MWVSWAIVCSQRHPHNFRSPSKSLQIKSDLHIDSFGVVKGSQDTPFSIQQYLQSHLDVMHIQYRGRLILPATINVLNVLSYKDKSVSSLNSLSHFLQAHLNIIADSVTHLAHKDCPLCHQTLILSFSQTALMLNGSTVT